LRYSRTVTLLATFAVASIAHAQTPPDYGSPITGRQAKVAAAAAVEVMRANNWNMAVAVVDPSGNLVYFEKIDATQHASVEIAMRKAKSAAAFKRPTKVFSDGIANNPGLATLPGVVASEGGVLRRHGAAGRHGLHCRRRRGQVIEPGRATQSATVTLIIESPCRIASTTS
jgi:glc operon protein GlcG